MIELVKRLFPCYFAGLSILRLFARQVAHLNYSVLESGTVSFVYGVVRLEVLVEVNLCFLSYVVHTKVTNRAKLAEIAFHLALGDIWWQVVNDDSLPVTHLLLCRPFLQLLREFLSRFCKIDLHLQLGNGGLIRIKNKLQRLYAVVA